jgi:hypothetical protein
MIRGGERTVSNYDSCQVLKKKFHKSHIYGWILTCGKLFKMIKAARSRHMKTYKEAREALDSIFKNS